MRISCFLLCFTLFYACNNSERKEQVADKEATTQYLHQAAFQQILDSAQVKGAILIYDAKKDLYYSNDFDWVKQGRLPASTFKITNSIIALETGVVENDSTLFEWNGELRALSVWEQDMIFRDAFHRSCVPCYQEIARAIGAARMNEYLQKLSYGNMVVDFSNIDLFWLQGNSRISPMEQIDFLQRLYEKQLPISDRTSAIMKKMIVMEETDDYKLSGKTGWAIRDGHNNGWFVGYLEKEEQLYFFATNVDPQETFNMDFFPRIRSEVTMKAFEELGILE
ncbi:MAG: class D beta-lactamase [Bacteroidota bacterium]